MGELDKTGILSIRGRMPVFFGGPLGRNGEMDRLERIVVSLQIIHIAKNSKNDSLQEPEIGMDRKPCDGKFDGKFNASFPFYC